MNIAFDATAILGPMSKGRGIGNYAVEQFREMISIDKQNMYYCLNFFENIELDELLGCDDNLSYKYLYCGKNNFMIKDGKYQDIIGDVIQRYISENSVDVFYITSPFDLNIIPYKAEWFGNVQTVATIYDIIPYVFKERYLADKGTYNAYMERIEFLKSVDHFFVISSSVKEDLIKYLGFEEAKITVIYGDISSDFKVLEISNETRNGLFLKYGIENKFVMCTGGDDDRKNIKELIIAFSKLNRVVIDEYQLVIVCKLSDDAVAKYSEVIIKNNLEGRVVLTNFVTQNELVQFYNLASLMAFPSQYEGFGLPIVEAMACGTPVLTSNNSSLGEIAGGAAILVNPFDIKDITRGLKEALCESNLEELIKKGFEVRNKFRWNQVALKTIDIFSKMNKPKQTENGRKKIAFFTPLPPIESGISDYSVDILNELICYIDIDVYIDSNYSPKCQLDDRINIILHKEYPKRKKIYLDTVYQMGNSYYHQYMYPYLRKYKGILVLHDYNMHGVFQAIALQQNLNDVKLYKEFLIEDYGKVVVEEYLTQLEKGECSMKINEMELNGYLSKFADKIIVHSKDSRNKLLEKNIGTEVKIIRSYAKIEPVMKNEIIKNNNGISSSTIILSAFGHIHETKRIMPILKAYKKLLKDYSNIQLILVGKVDASIRAVFEKYLNENVDVNMNLKVTGYIELDKFEEYIDMTDICLNLRFPYNGETSGSLMRILSKGKCVLVNDIGSFSEIPDEACVKLPSVELVLEETEVDNIYNSLKKMVGSEYERRKISSNARDYAERELDLNKIAKQYYEYIISNQENHLSEDILDCILIQESDLSQIYIDNKLFELAKTLTYSIMR